MAEVSQYQKYRIKCRHHVDCQMISQWKNLLLHGKTAEIGDFPQYSSSKYPESTVGRSDDETRNFIRPHVNGERGRRRRRLNLGCYVDGSAPTARSVGRSRAGKWSIFYAIQVWHKERSTLVPRSLASHLRGHWQVASNVVASILEPEPARTDQQDHVAKQFRFCFEPRIIRAGINRKWEL